MRRLVPWITACFVFCGTVSFSAQCWDIGVIGDICKICTPMPGGSYIKCDTARNTLYCNQVSYGWQTCGSNPLNCPGNMKEYTNFNNCVMDIGVNVGSCTIQMVTAATNQVFCP